MRTLWAVLVGTGLFTATAMAQTYQVLHSFEPVPGQYPSAGLIADSAGNLYGTTYQGGATAVGTVFKLDASNSYALTTLHSFEYSEGAYPQAALLVDSAGNLYGATQGGSQNCSGGCGTVFKLDASNGYALTTLHSFDSSDGAHPYGALIADSSGNLYGTTYNGGGPFFYGTVFKLDASNNYALTTLHAFTNSDGANPLAGLIAGPAGNLYGTTAAGGASGLGTVFKLDASNGYALTTLHSFTGPDGLNPYAALIADSSGNLYGTTAFGGASNYGTVFKLDASNGYALATLHSFTSSDGANPYFELIADSAGNIYGTTYYGGASGYPGDGTVFKLDASNGYALTTLHSFDYSDGANPLAALIADSAGNLYGTASQGGVSNYGTVFKLDASNGYALTTLHGFAYSEGANPFAALIADSSGNLYGTTLYGGASACTPFPCGTVFKLDASNGYALATLHSFTGADGQWPYAALIADSSGNLYGTTQLGGGLGPCSPYGCGTVFKLDASNGYALTTLHSFDYYSEGGHPQGALIADSAGNLYGTTADGGGQNYGTVFKLDAASNYALTTLHTFGYSDGAYPYAGLIADSSGNLYGTTFLGGPLVFSYGTVFKLDALYGYALTTLYTFTGGSDGAWPYAGLIADSAGNLYGTTQSYGAGLYGTVFRLDALYGYALTTLHSFAYSDGGIPHAALIADAAGDLYGTTSLGTVFKLNASNGYSLTTLYSFTGGSDGADPEAALIADSSGNLYGTARYNGTGGTGVVFRVPMACSPPIAVASGSAAICAGSSTPLSGSGGVSCSWSPATGLSNPNSCNPSASPASTTTYTLTVTDANGCLSTNNPTVTVTVNPAPPAPTITAPGWAAIGATAIMASVPNHSGSTYAWTVSGGTITTGQGSSSILFDAGPPGTTMVLGVVEIPPVGCPSAAGTANVQVDFLDVPPTHPFHDFVDMIARNGITAGCGAGNYCPDASVTRAQMAVFLLRGEHGRSYAPPTCSGIFADVPCPGGFAVDWIEQLSIEGITAGCSTSPLLYCAVDPVTRAQMAVFLLRTEHGPGYAPPACSGLFSDVPCPGGFAVDWIEQLYREGVTGGCSSSPPLYCPDNPNTRGQMAVFLTKTFGLQ